MSPSHKQVFIHVGLPKTATTFLQKQFFPNIKNINYIPLYPFLVYLKMKDGVNLISNETLYGDSIINPKTLSPTDIAKRIKELFPSAKIIVVFREKNSWLQSLYNDHTIRRAYVNKIKDFDDFYENYFDKSQLDFEGYKQCLWELFDDVIVLQFENFLKNKQVFLKSICEFMNVEMPIYKDVRWNSSFTDRQIGFIKWVGHLPYYGLYQRATHFLMETINKVN